MPQPERHFFTYGSLQIPYLQVGSGAPLVFFHGWGASKESFLPLVAALRLERTCILPDFPGFGEAAPPPEAWNVDAYADLAAALLRHVGNGAPVDALAHSFGGRVLIKLMARAEGTSVLGQVLITGGAGMKPRRKPMFYVRKYTAKLLKAPFMVLPSALREPGLARLRKTALWKSLGAGDYKSLDGVMREVFVKTVSEFLEPCLPRIPHAVLLVWGENDDATPLYQAERLRDGLAGAALVTIPAAGHYAFLDQTQRFARIAEAYFAPQSR